MSQEEMENKIDMMGELLNEIRNEQIKIQKNIDQYHKVNMKKFDKLKEFNEINDMTNQVFERRISNIEQMLNDILINIK